MWLRPFSIGSGVRAKRGGMAERLRSVDPLRPILSRPPVALASDIDGTLAPIVPNPEDATITPVCREALHQLKAWGVMVLLLTGRRLEEARRMVGLDDVIYAANHGLTLWINGREETPPLVREYEQWARLVLGELGAISVPGVSVEDKGPVLAFHYRRAADEAAARAAIMSALAASSAAGRFQMQEGRKVIELRPPVGIDKGSALRSFAQRLNLRAIVCLGDDATDVDMFRAVAQMRAEDRVGVTIAVASAESTPQLMTTADYSVDGVPGVEWLLGEIVKALPATPP